MLILSCFQRALLKELVLPSLFLAKDEDCALLGKCLASALNHEFGEELLSCHYSSSTDINRPCLILLPEKVKDEPAIACVQKAANELLVDFEHVCHDTH